MRLFFFRHRGFYEVTRPLPEPKKHCSFVRFFLRLFRCASAAPADVSVARTGRAASASTPAAKLDKGFLKCRKVGQHSVRPPQESAINVTEKTVEAHYVCHTHEQAPHVGNVDDADDDDPVYASIDEVRAQARARARALTRAESGVCTLATVLEVDEAEEAKALLPKPKPEPIYAVAVPRSKRGLPPRSAAPEAITASNTLEDLSEQCIFRARQHIILPEDFIDSEPNYASIDEHIPPESFCLATCSPVTNLDSLSESESDSGTDSESEPLYAAILPRSKRGFPPRLSAPGSVTTHSGAQQFAGPADARCYQAPSELPQPEDAQPSEDVREVLLTFLNSIAPPPGNPPRLTGLDGHALQRRHSIG